MILGIFKELSFTELSPDRDQRPYGPDIWVWLIPCFLRESQRPGPAWWTIVTIEMCY